MPATLTARPRVNLQKGLETYAELRRRVRETLLLGQQQIEQAKVQTYWETGKLIQKHLLANARRAEYGKQVLLKLSEDLEVSDSVLRRTVQFYNAFPISAARRKLSWRHYCELLPVRDEKTRFELVERAEKANWTSSQLANKIKAEFWPGNGRVSLTGPEEAASSINKEAAPLKAKLGTLYTYRLIQPDQVNEGKPYLLIDLGFATYRRLYEQKFKAGDIIESVQNSEGKYILKLFSPGRVDKNSPDSTRATEPGYTYQAIVEHIVDGDTLRVKVDLGFDTWTRQYLRLRGLDCPEIDTEEGKKAKRFVEKHLANAPYILLTSTRSDKYDRYLADVWIPVASSKPVQKEGSSLRGAERRGNLSSLSSRDERKNLSSPNASIGDPSKNTYLNQLLLNEGHAVRVA